MDLLLMGMGMGVVGGLMPSPLHFIALAQVALNRWARAIAILLGPPLIIDGALLVITLFFYQLVPAGIAHRIAYAGGVALVGFAGYSLFEQYRKTRQEMARSAPLTFAAVSAAAIAELGAPGTWVYWLTIAGPILAEGRSRSYWRVVPFFAGGIVGYYGAAILSVWLIAWGARLHPQLRQRLLLVANLLLLVLGVSYLVRARLAS